MTKVTQCFIIICLILQFYSVRAEDKPAASIDSLIHQLNNKKESKGIRVGMSVFDITKGDYLYQYDDNKSFVPASVHKLIVSAVALENLGKDYRYKTEIYAQGPVHDGVLEGDLLMKGYGDPSLSEKDLEEIVQQVKLEKGIREINGRILLDESYFDSIRVGRGWTWDDERWYYSAPISALSVERNRVKLTIETKAKKASIEMEPKTAYVHIENTVQVSAGSENKLQFDRPYHSNHIKVFGTLGKRAGKVEEELSVDEPALYVGSLLQKQLAAKGIKVAKGIEKKTEKTIDSKPLLVHFSQPLSKLVHHLNKESDNFYAEMFLKTLGATVKGEGSSSAGLEVVRTFSAKMRVQEGYQIADGSGLSRYNLTTPELMVSLLRFIQEQPYSEVFEQSLPYAGVDGTMKKRLIGTPAMKNLHAKTGSMSGVSSLAGYVTAANGHKLAFCIFTNGDYHIEDARVFQDQVVLLLTHYTNASGREDKKKVTKKKSSTFASKIDSILNQNDLSQVSAGVMIKSLDQNKLLYTRNEQKLFTPVSTTKLLLARTALHTLGKDYRFKTEVYWDKNDLFVKGYGDPSIRIKDLDTLITQMKAKGIHNIQGDLVLDESYFNPVRYPWGWSLDEEGRGNRPEISALSIEEGAAALHYQSGNYPGTAARIWSVPHLGDFIHVDNHTTTNFFVSDEPITFQKERQTNHVTAKGAVSWFGFEAVDQMAVHEPALYFGAVLKNKLEEAGILVNPTSRIRKDIVPAGIPKIAELRSQPLAHLIPYMLQTDNNQYAEMITKTLGNAVKQDSQDTKGSTTAGVKQIYKELAEAGVDATFDLYDGSGVSHYNQLSPVQMITGLDWFKDAAGDRVGILPVLGPGVKGVSGVNEGRGSFSGIVTNSNGERFAVVFMLNGYLEDPSIFSNVQKQILDVVCR